MSRFNLLCMFTFYTCFAAREPPTVTIPEQGTIMGKEISRSRVHKIIGYFGIPYANPPLDDLRFAPPETDNLLSWDDVRNATEYKPACLQTIVDVREEAKPFLNLTYPNYESFVMDEDCLYLNIFVPYGKPPPSGFATIIWFHPGNFTTGFPSMWNPHTLVHRYRIIVVTFAWRLGFMGFFSTLDGEAPGNYGMFDQQAAMIWVKKKISVFGGDPDNISLMGYGTGGVSVGLHMINSHSRQYFNKAIIMSANLLSSSVVKYPEEDKSLMDSLAKEYICDRKPTSKFIQCLRTLDGISMAQFTQQVNWRPLIDLNLSNRTPFLPEHPKNYFERNEFYKVPLLTGYTDMEDILTIKPLLEKDYSSTNFTNEDLEQLFAEIISGDIPPTNNTECVYNHDHLLDSVMFFYGPSSNVKSAEEIRKIMSDFITEKNYAASTFQLAHYLSKEQPTFVYRFDMKPSTSWVFDNIPKWVSVPHLYDLIYIWGMPFWLEFDDKNWSTRDRSFSDIIMSFWTNFAKSSDPTKNSLYPIGWDQFTTGNPNLLIIDSSFNMSSSRSLNYKAFEFWNDYYPKVLQIATQCCNAPGDAKFSAQASCLLLFTIQFLHLL